MAMTVVNREGQREDVKFDRILERIQGLAFGLAKQVEPVLVAKSTIEGLFDGVTTRQLDELAAETAAGMTAKHPDYGKLAARIAVSNLHKETSGSFSATIDALHGYVDPRTGLPAPLISDEVHAAVLANKDRLDTAIRHERDLEYDYFGYKTLERSYLLRLDGQVAERPQYMLMRVAVGIHLRDMEAVLETYDLLSRGLYTHATPTLFNAGTPAPQMSSCFLLAIKDDSLSGIYDTVSDCAQISKSAGGLGVSIHQVRAKGTYIRGTNGSSNGLVPMLRVFNATARYVDQGGGKRKGALAVYLEPWHPDVFDFLDLRKNTGAEDMRCRDIFTAMWVPDLFMKRVQDDANWSLLDPHECPGLHTSHAEAFEELYLRYEAQGKARRTVRAQELWAAIVQSQIETGTPYMLYKDHANRKSNQKNLGTIRSSNLCTEIMEYTDENEIAVCNLASVALPRFVKDGKYDHDALWQVVYRVTKSLNKVIDRNHYPVAQARASNLRHRPIGLGIQGLADTFALLKLPFESEPARQLNRHIFETLYHAALTASCDLAKEDGPYETFKGSPASQGLLQYDLWNEQPTFSKWDWIQLKQKIAQHGLRNSLLVAPMPTASTSQILGNNECFEPFTSNLYARRTLSGEFMVVNQHLVRDLIQLGLWSDSMKDQIIRGKGSIQHIESIPAPVRELYKTVWEIKQKTIVDLAADRGAFIDQSQSMNIHMLDANYAKVTSLHFHAWKRGLKTGMYYLRTKAAADAIQFTLDPAKKPVAAALPVAEKPKAEVEAEIACSIDNPESCVSCGS